MKQAGTIPRQSLASGLHSAAIHLLRHLRKQDAALGIGPARLSALSVLVFGGPRSLSALAAAEQVTAATMSRIVRGLEDESLVERHRSPDDGRSFIIEATPAGREAMKLAQKARLSELESMLDGLKPSERICLERAVGIVRNML